MDLEKLNQFIAASGISKSDLAEKLNLSRQSLYLKLSGERSFTGEETCALASILRMTVREILDIFFADWVRKYEN